MGESAAEAAPCSVEGADPTMTVDEVERLMGVTDAGEGGMPNDDEEMDTELLEGRPSGVACSPDAPVYIGAGESDERRPTATPPMPVLVGELTLSGGTCRSLAERGGGLATPPSSPKLCISLPNTLSADLRRVCCPGSGDSWTMRGDACGDSRGDSSPRGMGG